LLVCVHVKRGERGFNPFPRLKLLEKNLKSHFQLSCTV